MKVITTVVGLVGDIDFDWPEDWPIPRVDDSVTIPATGARNLHLWVRAVDWYPLGDPREQETEPFVYVVIGTTKRGGT